MPPSLPANTDLLRRVPQISDMTLADIPAEIGLFPLSGIVLLPHGKLPLNVFEPRYIALVEDALVSHRLIGIIQPDIHTSEQLTGQATIPLYKTGCVGRIISFAEKPDNTFVITLRGIIRFRTLRETQPHRNYRCARIDASGFAGDLSEVSSAPFDRKKLLTALRYYLSKKNINVRWSAIEQMEDDILLITLPMICPFPPAEKQALLDAATLSERINLLHRLLDLTGL